MAVGMEIHFKFFLVFVTKILSLVYANFCLQLKVGLLCYENTIRNGAKRFLLICQLGARLKVKKDFSVEAKSPDTGRYTYKLTPELANQQFISYMQDSLTDCRMGKITEQQLASDA